MTREMIDDVNVGAIRSLLLSNLAIALDGNFKMTLQGVYTDRYLDIEDDRYGNAISIQN